MCESRSRAERNEQEGEMYSTLILQRVKVAHCKQLYLFCTYLCLMNTAEYNSSLVLHKCAGAN